MKKTIVIALLLALFANTVSARPKKKWFKDPKFLTVAAVTITASALATHYGHTCRQQNGIAPCSGGYGPFAARESVRMGLSIGMLFASGYMRHEDILGWWAPALATASFNGVVAYRQGTKGCGPGREFIYGTKTCGIEDELKLNSITFGSGKVRGGGQFIVKGNAAKF